MKIIKKLNGYKTYLGLVVALLGVAGLGDIVSEQELSQVIDSIISIVGLAIATYGRYDAGRRMK